MAQVNIYDLVFPVCSGEDQVTEARLTTVISQVSGTAFAIGKGFFLTAAHVIDQTSSNTRRISCTENGKLIGFLPRDVEVIDGLDLGIIYSPEFPKKNILHWSSEPLARLNKVFSSGYPFAFDPETMVVSARAFMGDVAGINNFHKFKLNPKIYELSFACPRGLSGGPLIAEGAQPRVCGMVIGNITTEMNIFTDREEITEERTTIVERYEAMNLGIAVSAEAIFQVESKLLGCSLGEHLAEQQLLQKH